MGSEVLLLVRRTAASPAGLRESSLLHARHHLFIVAFLRPCVFHRYLPHVGQVTIIMNDYPALKYALIAVLGLFVITSKE